MPADRCPIRYSVFVAILQRVFALRVARAIRENRHSISFLSIGTELHHSAALRLPVNSNNPVHRGKLNMRSAVAPDETNCENESIRD